MDRTAAALLQKRFDALEKRIDCLPRGGAVGRSAGAGLVVRKPAFPLPLFCVEGQNGDALVLAGREYRVGEFSPVGLIKGVYSNCHGLAMNYYGEPILLFPYIPFKEDKEKIFDKKKEIIQSDKSDAEMPS